MMTWILTFPGCGLIGFITTKIFMAIFGLGGKHG
jgi:PiT family inorganic phosphate transporter